MLIPVNLEELLILNLYNQGLCIIISLPLSNTALETTSWRKAHERILKWKKKTNTKYLEFLVAIMKPLIILIFFFL